MGVLSKLADWSLRTLDAVGEAFSQGPRASLEKPEPWFVRWATTGNGEPGQPIIVNETAALNYLAVYDCVSLIAGTIASLPLVTYRRSGRDRVRATDRREYRLFQVELNPEMSALAGREAGCAHLLTYGNSFTQIVRNKSGSEVRDLWPIGPDVVKVLRDRSTRKLGYEVRQRGSGELLVTLDSSEVLHTPALGFDGICGYSPIRIASKAIRAGMSLDAEAEKFATKGFRPPGAVKLPAGRKFKDEQSAIKWRDQFRKLHMTEDSSLGVVILEDGAEWQAMGVDPKTTQLLESRKFSRSEICGLYRVPPHLVSDVERSTSWGTGIEEQTTGFIVYTLMPWMKRIEQEANRKLFPAGDYYVEHLIDGLLRGDALRRAQALEIQHRRGIITDNEWREGENRNPLPGGDVRHFPLNEGRVDDQGNDLVPLTAEPTPAPAPAPEPPPEE